MESKDFYVSRTLLDQVEKIESPEDVVKHAAIANSNIGHFYAALYHGMIYGGKGKLTRLYKTNIQRMMDGQSRVFRPDIVIQSRYGTGYVEVKATSTKNSRPHCSYRQLENYLYSLFRRINAGDSAPFVEYAIFRYGTSRTMNGLGKINKQDLVERLCRGTRDLLIMPSNLVLWMFAISQVQVQYGKELSNGGPLMKSRPNGSTITMLHKGLENFSHEDFQDPNGLRNLAIDLFIDKLRVHKSFSPMLIVDGVNFLIPFSITRYYLPGNVYPEWISHLNRNRKEILGNLKLDDLVAINEEIPF